MVNEESVEFERRKAGHFLSFYNILNIVTNLTSFKKWLKEFHGLEEYKELLDGYVFFLDACFSGLIDAIISENSFDIEDDHAFFRARFVGIDIYEIPNTCEKIIFIKNIWEKTKNIRNSTSWEEITGSIKDIKELLTLFEKIYENNIVPINGLLKNEALNSATILKTYLFLNDVKRGIPLAYKFVSILNSDMMENQTERSYIGYAYTLQYLWYILLQEQKFQNSSLKNLHRAHEIYPREVSKKYLRLDLEPIRSKSYLGGSFDKLFGTVKSGVGKKFSWLGLKSVKPKKDLWDSLDTFFEIIRNEIIKSLEEELKKKSNYNNISDSLLFCQNFDKAMIEDQLVKDKLRDPEYLSKKDKKSVYKKLDYDFMWYKVDALNSGKTSVFNGVPAFTLTLKGNIEEKRRFDNDREIFVLRIKHPAGKEIYDYSYGILIEAFGGLGFTDYSGWLIFFDCATDYSSFAGSLHYEAEKCIKDFSDEGLIKIKEITVNKNFFAEYLSSRNISRSLEEIQEKAKNVCRESRGTDAEKIACAVSREVQQWEVRSPEEMAFYVENFIITLESKIPRLPENEHIFEMIEESKNQKDINNLNSSFL